MPCPSCSFSPISLRTQQNLELVKFDLPTAIAIDLVDELLNVYGKTEVLFDDAYEGFAFDVAFLVGLAPTRNESVNHVVFVVKVLLGQKVAGRAREV